LLEPIRYGQGIENRQVFEHGLSQNGFVVPRRLYELTPRRL